MAAAPRIKSRLWHLSAPLVFAAVSLVVAGPAGWFAGGVTGAAAALAGVTLVTFSYLLSSVAVAWADSVRPALVLNVGLAAYALKFTLFGTVMFAVAASGWSGLPTMAVAMIMTTVGWVAVQVWWIFRARIAYVQISPE